MNAAAARGLRVVPVAGPDLPRRPGRPVASRGRAGRDRPVLAVLTAAGDGQAAMTGDGAALPSRVLAAHLRYLQLAGYAASSVYSRRRALARMAAAIGVPLLEATPADLLAWRVGLEGLAPESVASYVSHAREFWSWAAAAGLCEGNPAAGLPVPRVPRRLPRPIGEREILAAVAAAPPRVRAMLVLAGWAGLRACEIAGLRRAAILDTADPPVLVVAADATKGQRERIVPLSPFVLAELRGAGLPRSGYVFGRRDGQPGPMSAARVSHLCNDHLHECGLAETLHQLRHRFATMVYRDRRDLRLVQELLGHANPATTAGYAAFCQDEAARAVAALPAPGPARVPGAAAAAIIEIAS